MSNIVFILTSLMLAFGITFAIMPISIRLFTKWWLGKNIRAEWLIGKATQFAKLHEGKKWTPTMWWAVMIAVVIFLTLVSVAIIYLQDHYGWFPWINIKHSLWNRQETYIALFTLVSVGIIGVIDDYLNIREIGRTKGLPARVKMTLLIIFGLMGAYWFYAKLGYTHVHIPFIGDTYLGVWYIPLFVLIFVSAANSVNITDGLDGLAGGLLLFQFLAYGAITYVGGLYILSALCLIIVGVLMAFLWFNIHPAHIFMGDVGSLAFGATLAVVAMMTDTLVAFIIMSSIFIFETLSVIIQMTSKRLRNGKKIFRVAPFHHHLEAIWWQEETIVMRLWLIGMILAVAGVVIALGSSL